MHSQEDLMPDDETQQLITAAKADVEACAQLEFWVSRLRCAIEARHQLLDVSPDELRTALESKR